MIGQTWGAKATANLARLIGAFGSSGPSGSNWLAGDIAPDSRGRFWICTVGYPSTPQWVQLGRNMVFDIRDFGATGGADDTAYIQAAITAAQNVSTPPIKLQNSSGQFQGGAASSGAGIVWVPFLANVTNVVGGHRVHIGGAGWGTGFRQIASSTGPVYSNRRDGSVHAKYTGLQNLAIIGNRANQSSSTNHGVYLLGETGTDSSAYQNPLDEDYDEAHHITNVYIWDCKGDGLRMAGSGGNQILGVKIRSNDGNGLYSFQDNDISNVDVGWSGLRGVFIDGDDCRLSCVKAWYSGQITAASGQGFYLTSDSGVMSDCSAQDNTAQGLLLDGAFGWDIAAFMADSNSKGSAGTYAQVDVYGSQNNNLSAAVRNRYNNGGPGTVALNVANGSVQNKLDINPGTGVWGVSTILKSGSVLSGNEVNFGSSANGMQEVAYASTITPNILQGRRLRIGDVTGPMTIANPTYKYAGAVLEVRFKMNATGGYTLTLGSDFDSSITLNNAANAVNNLKAVYSATSGKWEPWS